MAPAPLEFSSVAPAPLEFSVAAPDLQRRGGGVVGRSEDDVALKLLHTADWHLGMTFPSFEPEARLRLSRARLDVIDRILGLAERHRVHAVLCAGDLFDDPDPGPEWWEGLAKKFQARDGAEWRSRPVFLLPGNHDPLTSNGVYSKTHPFRAALPSWVHVVDTDDFSHELEGGAKLFAAPCRSRSESRDLARSLLPARPIGDDGLRIGMVHGQTFDLPGCQLNFPISLDAAAALGLDYLAIGDTHSLRDVTPDAHAPTIYPGAPEPTHFGEQRPGQVVVAYFPRDRRRRALIHEEPVAQWTWQELRCTDLEQLRALGARDLAQHVVRLVLDLKVSLGELAELEKLLVEFQGTPAAHGKIGVLSVDRSGLGIVERDVDASFRDAPEILRATAARLRALADERAASPAEAEVAKRALYQLYRLTREAS